MHKELLSEKERLMLDKFLEFDEKAEGFRMLKMRIKRNYPTICKDFVLLTQAMNKLQSKST